jgi:hypothetical protein
MREHPAQRIIGHLADEGRAGAEGRQTGDRVGRRSARDLDRRSHCRIEPFGLGLVDKAHRALDKPLADQEIVLGTGQDIDNGVADADDIKSRFRHFLPPVQPKRGL